MAFVTLLKKFTTKISSKNVVVVSLRDSPNYATYEKATESKGLISERSSFETISWGDVPEIVKTVVAG